MRTTLVSIATFVVFAACATGAFAERPVQPREPKRAISVNGSATVSAQPDRARVSFSIENQAKTAELASRGNATASDAVVKALKAAVGADGKVTTSGYSLRPEYSYHEQSGNRRRTLVGYTATNTLQAVIGDLTKVGALIDAAVAAGATGADSIQFFREDMGPARKQALLEAGRNARAEAETIAESLGVALGALLEASSSTSEPVTPYPKVMAMREAAVASTPIEAGDVTISANVFARFEIR